MTDFPPSWALAFGDDRFGLWAEFALGGVRQRMRWIAPGRFWMGSPEDEPKRHSDEGPRHEVAISQGFWLADTTCTQALWLALMGGPNPSEFATDPENPVEQVSWDDVQAFLARLVELLAAPAALPTEAEWEYACRAGKQEPFFWGGTVTTAQVNFNGNYPYNGGAKGESRERTVPVKALPANAWGLYQMHGNVWEWCADGIRDYAAARALEVDPQGPLDGAQFAVRGGSWIYDAWRARSACRFAYARAYRFDFLGFRFALRSRNTSASAAAEPLPSPGPEARGQARRDAGPAPEKGAADHG